MLIYKGISIKSSFSLSSDVLAEFSEARKCFCRPNLRLKQVQLRLLSVGQMKIFDNVISSLRPDHEARATESMNYKVQYQLSTNTD